MLGDAHEKVGAVDIIATDQAQRSIPHIRRTVASATTSPSAAQTAVGPPAPTCPACTGPGRWEHRTVVCTERFHWRPCATNT